MENFELIDRFFEKDLNEEELQEFERRLNEEDTFQEDLAFYEAMNSGVYSLEKTRLKKKLDGLYELYTSEKPSKKTFPLPWIVGIAASVLIAGYFLVFRVATPQEEIANRELPETNEQREEEIQMEDTTSKQSAEEDLNPDTSTRLPDGVLAFGGIAALPPNRIMTFSYPEPLRYAFDGRTLRIKGDPLLPALALDIVKKEKNYQLNYLDKSYKLKTTGTFLPLGEPTTQINGTASSEKITVVFESLLSAAIRNNQLRVKISRQRGKPGFVFEENNEITLAGNFELGNTQVFLVDFEEEEILVVKRDNDLFILEGKPSSLKPMVTARTVNNKLASLFDDRSPIILNVQVP